jgi:hypothetical protein
MIKAIVNNFRKIEKAEIEVSRITLVGGNNEAGKTSLSQAIGAALVGNATVLGVPKKEANLLVRDGSKFASVKVQNDKGGETQVSWPSMEVVSNSNAPRASIYAAGKQRFTSLPKQDAAGLISSLMKAEPKKSDFWDVAVPLLGEKKAEVIWNMIDAQGWDATFEYIQEQARELKAEYKIISNEQWGSKKSENWMPEGFSFDAQSESEEALEAAIKVAQTQLEEAIAANAVTGDKINVIKAEADKFQDLVKRKGEKEALIAEAKILLEDTQKALDDIPEIPPQNLICPHCAGEVMLMEKSLIKAESITEEEREKIKKNRTDAITRRDDCKKKLNDLEKELQVIMLEGKAAQKAVKELEQLGLVDTTVDAAEADRKINGFREAVAMSSKRLEMFRKWKRAGTTHTRIVNALAIAEQVAPSGIRQRKAGEAVEAFNTNHLYPLCQAFGIAPVTLDLDMNVLYRSHLYQFLSESAKFRIDCILQVAIARIDGSEMIIIDGADIIVGKDRSGILNLLLYGKIPALVFMSMAKIESMPVTDMKTVGGTCYWVDKSVTTAL